MNQTRQKVHCLWPRLSSLPTMIPCSFAGSTDSVNLNLAYSLTSFHWEGEVIREWVFYSVFVYLGDCIKITHSVHTGNISETSDWDQLQACFNLYVIMHYRWLRFLLPAMYLSGCPFGYYWDFTALRKPLSAWMYMKHSQATVSIVVTNTTPSSDQLEKTNSLGTRQKIVTYAHKNI